MADYLDPVVATVVGDISDLLAKIAEAQGAMTAFAEGAPAIQFDTGALGGGEQLGADVAAGMETATPAVADLEQEMRALEEAIAAADSVAAEDTARLVEQTQAMLAAAEEATTMSHVEAEGAAAAHQAALDHATALEQARQAAQEASFSFGTLGADARGLAIALGIVEAATIATGLGVGVLGAAVVGAGFLIASFGGNAQDAFQQIEGAFRGTAEQASVAFEPAINAIIGDFRGLAQEVEPDVAEIFSSLAGPAEAFGAQFADAIAQGVDAAVPAIEQLEPLIATVAADIGPLVQGVAGFVQQMAAAFEAAGGGQELAGFASEIGQLLPVLGQLVGELGGGLLPVAEAVTPILTAIGDVLNALGPNFDTAIAAAILLGKGWSLINDVSGPLEAAFTTLQGLMAEYTAGSEMAAAASAETGAAMDAEAMEAELAAIAFADTVAAMLPIIAAAGLVALAAYEIVDHWSAVSGFFEQAAQDAYNWGSDIGEGIGRGLTDAWNFIVKPIEDSINGIKNMFTSGFGIMSPSTVTRGYGVNLGEGVGLGVLDSLGGVQSQIGTFTAATLGAFGAGGIGGGTLGGGGVAAAPSAGGGQGSMVVYLSVQVEGQPFYTASAAEIEEVILPVLQQLNSRNGTTMAAQTGGRT